MARVWVEYVSRFQGFKVSRFQGFNSSKFQVNFVDSCRDSAYFKQVWSALAAPRVPSSKLTSLTLVATRHTSNKFGLLSLLQEFQVPMVPGSKLTSLTLVATRHTSNKFGLLSLLQEFQVLRRAKRQADYLDEPSGKAERQVQTLESQCTTRPRLVPNPEISRFSPW